MIGYTSNNEVIKNNFYIRKEEDMATILEQLESEEIAAYKEELRKYLDEIPDKFFYEYFNIRPMTDEIYDGKMCIRDRSRIPAGPGWTRCSTPMRSGRW